MILVCGGLGFIGSHTCIELMNNGMEIIIVDDLSNSKIQVVDVLYNIKTNVKNIPIFYQKNLLDYNDIEYIFKNHKIDGVIHFAAFKAVGESIKEPLKYYENNIQTTINLLKLCKKYDVNNFIFSSSATVYGNSKSPLNENSPVGEGITNPYGRTKYFIEEILKDTAHSSNIKVIALRYFNPVGAHENGLIGEDPNGIPNNLMPYLLKVAIKNNLDDSLDDIYNNLNIFGDDYETIDGTGVRDYIHVVDLADAHVKAMKKIYSLNSKFRVYNIGTGNGT